MNRFPAIYDLAGLRDSSHGIGFEKSLVDGSAIYHLHGQHTGYLLLSTKEKLAEQAARIRPVLEAEIRGKTIMRSLRSGCETVPEWRRHPPRLGRRTCETRSPLDGCCCEARF